MIKFILFKLDMLFSEWQNYQEKIVHRIVRYLLFILIFLLFIIGCQRADRDSSEYVLVNGSEPESLDPHKFEGMPEFRIYWSLFEGLATIDPVTGGPVPGLAESWEISDDGLQYTFKLRKTVWSDGIKITAQTVVDSWLRGMNPETASPSAWLPNMFIKGAEDYNSGAAGPEAVQIRALDDYIFQIDLVGPLPYVIDALTSYAFAVVPMHNIEKYGSEWIFPEHFVGNGPFLLEEWKPNEYVSVVPNNKYWDKKNVRLSRVIYLPVEDNVTVYNMFKSGEVDWITEIPKDMIEQAKQNGNTHIAPSLETYYYVINNYRPPFDDPRVRKALAISFDRKELVDSVSRGGEVPAYSFIPPNMPGYPGDALFQENIEKARELLAAAGFPDGKGFPFFDILYNDSDDHKKIAEYIQQAWEENLGVKCRLYNEVWQTYLAARRAHDFAVARAAWTGDYTDANTFLGTYVSGNAGNDGLYSNQNYDAAIRKAAIMPDSPERQQMLRKAETYLIGDDMGVIPIYFYVSTNMIDTKKWGGWFTNIRDFHPLKNIYLKQ